MLIYVRFSCQCRDLGAAGELLLERLVKAGSKPGAPTYSSGLCRADQRGLLYSWNSRPFIIRFARTLSCTSERIIQVGSGPPTSQGRQLRPNLCRWRAASDAWAAYSAGSGTTRPFRSRFSG